MNQHQKKTLDYLYRSLLGRSPARGETLRQWRSAGRLAMRNVCVEASARGVISDAQHMARKAETETADLLARLKIYGDRELSSR